MVQVYNPRGSGDWCREIISSGPMRAAEWVQSQPGQLRPGLKRKRAYEKQKWSRPLCPWEVAQKLLPLVAQKQASRAHLDFLVASSGPRKPKYIILGISQFSSACVNFNYGMIFLKYFYYKTHHLSQRRFQSRHRRKQLQGYSNKKYTAGHKHKLIKRIIKFSEDKMEKQ